MKYIAHLFLMLLIGLVAPLIFIFWIIALLYTLIHIAISCHYQEWKEHGEPLPFKKESEDEKKFWEIAYKITRRNSSV